MATPTTSAASSRRVMGTPIVLERKGGGRKRKPRLKDADRAERHLYRAARRTVDATDRGLRRYDKSRKRSARRERDGALIELVPNVASGMTVTAVRLTPVPLDLLRAGYAGPLRRTTRRSVKATARMFDTS